MQRCRLTGFRMSCLDASCAARCLLCSLHVTVKRKQRFLSVSLQDWECTDGGFFMVVLFGRMSEFVDLTQNRFILSDRHPMWDLRSQALLVGWW